ncbi:MAG: hypothetical protein RIT04_311 [Candidatus Parcubacteria bacterium]|jgi:methylase of polypeptide subunit release factors
MKNEKYTGMEEARINPELTQNFVRDSLEKAENGTYHVEVKIGDKNIPIDVFPEVFPPKSDYSVSSRSVYETFGNLQGKEIADIGTGTGIESIVAVLAGADHVDATDINITAVECAQHNIDLNGLNKNISVFQGDLFSGLPSNKKYDLIIANLPIVNFKPEKQSPIIDALYDPDFSIHKRLLVEGRDHLSENGYITFTHANLQSAITDNPESDFDDIEKVITENNYEIVEKKNSEALGYTWINYKIRPLVIPE